MIVTTYGAIWRKAEGISLITGICPPTTASEVESPKRREASIAPTGFHLPKIIAANEMKPCPAIVATEKLPEIDWA